MSVDISTWRARVGMFIPKTSQKSPLIFTAQPRSRLPNNEQTPGSIPENSIPSPQTDIKDARLMLMGHQKPNSTHAAHKGDYVACTHLSYILHVLLLISVLLIESPSELRPQSSYPPVNPDQNETSPMQLSYVQSLIILMSGDVEVNPGPPNKYEERAKKLTKFTVPVEDIICPEYCSNFKVDFTLKNKDPGYLEQMEDIVQTACAMLNYAGGVITLNPKTASTAGTDKQRDEWVDEIQQQLKSLARMEVSRCIEIKTDLLQTGHIEIWLTKIWDFVTYKLPLYVKPSFVSMVGGIQWNQLNHGDRFPLSEGMSLEFKYYRACDATSLLARITNDEIRGEPKLIKTLLAFTNTEGGGDAIIGIKEVQGALILEGQKLSDADEEIVRKYFDKLMEEGLNGEQQIWPFTPQSGSEWTINFYPLGNCPNNDRHVLIHTRVNQVGGFVLGDEPEAYTMTPEGNIRHVPLNEWKDCMLPPSINSAPELIKLGPQSNKQDNDDDDIYQEQFTKLVDDLKSHRVTLSSKHIKSALWTKDSEDSQDDIMPGVNMDTCVDEVSKSEILMPSSPSTWVPDKTILDRWVTNSHPDMKKCVDAIDQSHSQEAVVIGTKCFGHLFPRLSMEMPQNHVFDFIVLQGNAEVDLWIVFDDFGDNVTCKRYINSATRMLKSQLLSYMHLYTYKNITQLAIKAKVWSIADNCTKYEIVNYPKFRVDLPILQKAVAYCLLQGRSHIRNRLGEEYLIALTKDQFSHLLLYSVMGVMVFQGPPGSGKSIIAQHLCEREARARNLVKDQILYICPYQPLAEFIKFQGICDAKFTKTEELIHTIREALTKGTLLVIIDDAHLFLCSKDEWFEILMLFKLRFTTERHLAVFFDPEYQNFQDDKTKNLSYAIIDFKDAEPFSSVTVHAPLRVMIRNSRSIFSFFKSNAAEISRARLICCAHDFQGDGVSVTYTPEDFFQGNRYNPVIKLAEEIVGMYNFEENFTYKETDITILVDADGKGNAEQAVQKLYKIFNQFYPEAKTQRASQFPVKGIVIEELKYFSGLETRVCILVLTCKDTSVLANPRYKCFVASRGITKLVFLLHGDTVDSSFRQLKFSEEKQWQKQTRQLKEEIPEKGSSDDWLITNVPDTECWHTTKPFMIIRCQQQLQLENPETLADWVDSNIPSAWRHDAQFVKAVIGSALDRTIRKKSPTGYILNSAQLRSILSALNCLYGTPEALQLKALDYVYDHVDSLQHPDKVLQEVLDILWCDGYMSRQAIGTWTNNMEQTKRQACYKHIQLQGMDLGEQIQERMKDRQEVREWMQSPTQMGCYYSTAWYDSPHYQRVALHALCQLAVIWQGDKSTVDRDLLFLYIPQLYCYTRDGLQLLYAVQCVLHQLQNPPGLAVAVLKALVSPTPARPEPIITELHLGEWRETEHPAYEEGRESMLLPLTNLNI